MFVDGIQNQNPSSRVNTFRTIKQRVEERIPTDTRQTNNSINSISHDLPQAVTRSPQTMDMSPVGNAKSASLKTIDMSPVGNAKSASPQSMDISPVGKSNTSRSSRTQNGNGKKKNRHPPKK